MESAGIFLRFPGQWDDPSFRSHGLREGLYYNVHRYYLPGTGRYTRPDPWRSVLHNAYLYADSNPLTSIDPLGHARITNNSCQTVLNPKGVPPALPGWQ